MAIVRSIRHNTMSLRKTIDSSLRATQAVSAAGWEVFGGGGFVRPQPGGDRCSLGVGPLATIRRGPQIRGWPLSADGSQLLLSHPILAQRLPTTHDNIFWGSIVGNAIRAIDLRNVLTLPPPAEIRDPTNPVVPIGHWSLYALGEQGNAAGDPNALAVTRDGRVMVALAGVDEVAVGSLPQWAVPVHPGGPSAHGDGTRSGQPHALRRKHPRRFHFGHRCVLLVTVSHRHNLPRPAAAADGRRSRRAPFYDCA